MRPLLYKIGVEILLHIFEFKSFQRKSEMLKLIFQGMMVYVHT